MINGLTNANFGEIALFTELNQVDFHYPPTCGRNNNWVLAHWYETGTWSGDSRGIKATGKTMEVEGQTRFFVSDELKITEFVVTRTFTEWEDALQKQT